MEAQELLALLEGPGGRDVVTLRQLWEQHAARWIPAGPELFAALGNRILRLGEPLLAFDVLDRALHQDSWGKHTGLRRLRGLALASSGSTRRANVEFSGLAAEGHRDPETLGLLARTHKDLAQQYSDPQERNTELRKASALYEEGYRTALKEHLWDKACWCGINAACVAVLRGVPEVGRKIAREVRDLCLKMAGDSGDSYWLRATLGEAALILGEIAGAEEHYGEAMRLGKGLYRDLASTRRQAGLLLGAFGLDPAEAGRWIPIPPVAIYAGHMVDRPGRPHPRFPVSDLPRVSGLIEDFLTARQPGFAYASAACGGDILFLEAMLKRGSEINLVLPYPPDEFIRTSVEGFEGGDWVGRFEALRNSAATIFVANDHRPERFEMLLDYTNRVLTGLGVLRAKTLCTELLPIALWDGRPGDGLGGTASMVAAWRERGWTPEILPIRTDSGPGGAAAIPRAPSEEPDQKIVALLFADAVHYSDLSERQIPSFVREFMGEVAAVIDRSDRAPLVKNTWGDGLYLVFDDVLTAGRVALELTERIRGIAWETRGLRAGLNLRIALHAGPTYVMTDPVTNLLTYTGAHVSRAARIEPITEPGEVYASRQFAALASQPAAPFVCEYVGRVPLAKHAGLASLFHVRRTSD